MTSRPLRIVWTNHAVLRAMRRFRHDPPREIPVRAISDEGRRKRAGDEWKVRDRGVVYVCVREGDSIVIVTVYRSKRRRAAWAA